MQLAFLSSTFCLLFLFLFPLPSSAYRPIIDGSRKHSDHNLHKPPTGCKTIPEPNPRRLTVYHSRGPCSPTGQKPQAIDTVEATDDSREDVHLGNELDTNNYVVTIGLGTPRRDMTVLLDTGSAITWVQCSPCPTTKCHTQKDDLFFPNMSSTYQTFDCLSSQCEKLPSTTSTCSANYDSCSYETTYMDNSRSSGQFVSDRLTLNAGNTIDAFLFGCGHDQSSPLFGRTSGLLGLGPPTTSPSLLNQAAGTSIGPNFAYCLPKADSPGYLEFPAGADDGSSFATLTLNDGYFVELVGVEVNGVELSSIISTKMMVDTGTMLSQLPPELYSELKTLVEAAAGEALVQDDSRDNCYDTGVNGTRELPINVTLNLGGGAQLVLDYASVFYQNGSLTCLAFEKQEGENYLPVLGNTQQRTYGWAYDIDNSRIAITPDAC